MRSKRDRFFILFGLSESTYSWRGVWLLFFVFLGAIVFAAMTSPFVFWGFEFLAGKGESDAARYVVSKGLPKTFDRLRWLPVLVGLPWLIKVCGLMNWKRLGFALPPGWLKASLAWWFVGVGLLALATVGQVLFLGAWPDGTLPWSGMIKNAVSLIFAGLILSFLEETVFRGLVFRLFYTAVKPVWGVLLSAFFFAIVHFKKIPDTAWAEDFPVHAWSGLYLGVWTVISVVATFDLFQFLNLFLAGLILALLFLKTRSLFCCMGLHAGWFWYRELYRDLFSVGEDGPWSWLWGSENVIDGVFPTLILIALAVYLFQNPGKGRTDGNPGTCA